MRLHILHETRYTYNIPVHAVAMEARLQPCNDDYQFCHRYRLIVTPRTSVQTYTTFSDVIVHYWTLLKATEIVVLSESEVEIRERPLAPVPTPPQPIDHVDVFPYTEPSSLIGITPEIRDFAAPFELLAQEDWYQAAKSVSEAIYKSITFNVGCTNTRTKASEVLELGCGVCQDFTHLMIATLRALGIPARYVSGYLNQRLQQEMTFKAGGFAYQSMSQTSMEQVMHGPTPDGPGERSVRGTGASHAWCEVYLGPENGWRGFDPTNNLLADQNFVRIGAGRDFADLTPLKGVHKGPAEEQLQVRVNVG